MYNKNSKAYKKIMAEIRRKYGRLALAKRKKMAYAKYYSKYMKKR